MFAQNYECKWYQWIVHLKMVKMVNIMFCIFYHNKKSNQYTPRKKPYITTMGETQIFLSTKDIYNNSYNENTLWKSNSDKGSEPLLNVAGALKINLIGVGINLLEISIP